MKNFKYILFYSEKFRRYKLLKVNLDKLNENDERILYVFSLNRVKLARKIQNNLNKVKNSLLPDEYLSNNQLTHEYSI